MKPLLFLVMAPILALGQSSEAKRMVDLINNTYKSDSAVFIFDLEAIPSAITNKILRMNDSTSYQLYKEGDARKMKKFMANTYGKWNATDNLENVKWPMRRYIYGVKKGAKWIITYEHGGIGNHYHIVFLDNDGRKVISTATTLVNANQIHGWIWEHKVEEFKKRSFITLLNADDFKLLNGRLVKSYDVW